MDTSLGSHLEFVQNPQLFGRRPLFDSICLKQVNTLKPLLEVKVPRFPDSVRMGTADPVKLSIIIPVFNERATLEPLLERVKRVDLPLEREIIVVDDGSTDGTEELLRPLESRDEIRACFHTRNHGKGAAVRTGLQRASGDIILIQDGDLEYDPADYPRLIRPITEKRVKVVYGSRVLGRNKPSYIRYYLGGRFLSFMANIIYGIHITDEPTCYKVFDARLLKGLELECRGFEFCAEVTAKVSCLGERILEVPISYMARSMREGKKIRWTDGVIAVWTLIRYRKWRPGYAQTSPMAPMPRRREGNEALNGKKP